MDLAKKLFEGIHRGESLSIPILKTGLEGHLNKASTELRVVLLSLARTLEAANSAIERAGIAANSDTATIEVENQTTFQGEKNSIVQLGTWVTRSESGQITSVQTGESMTSGIFTGFVGDNLDDISRAIFAYGEMVEISEEEAIAQGCVIQLGKRSYHMFPPKEENELLS